jgi:hypothetical protein
MISAMRAASDLDAPVLMLPEAALIAGKLVELLEEAVRQSGPAARAFP